MTKNNDEIPTGNATGNVTEGAGGAGSVGVTTTGTPDPMQTGITALRDAGLDPLQLWTLKAPKDAGGVVSAVFLQGDSSVVIMHQFPSGKYALFKQDDAGGGERFDR